MYQPTPGDVVQNTTVSFLRDFPNHTGTVESVTRESNGWFARVEWQVEVESMSPRARKVALANGMPKDAEYHVFLGFGTPARSLTELA